MTIYTNPNQDLTSGNVPVRFIPQSEITFDSNGAPILTHVVKSIPTPAGLEESVEIGGNLAEQDPIAFKTMSEMVDANLESLPVFVYEDAYTVEAGAVVKYGSSGEFNRVVGDSEYNSNIDQYMDSGSLPDGRYIGTDKISHGTQLTVTVKASDTGGTSDITKTMSKQDIMGATTPVLDIWRWDNPEWFKGTAQSPNNLMFGKKYSTSLSFPNTKNFFTY